jgi:hypothetical protein
MRRPYRTTRIVVSVLVGGFAALVACSNAGEGERCEFDNGNADCKSGLVCLPKTPRQGAARTVNPPYGGEQGSDRCCPEVAQFATHPACTLATNPIGSDAEPNLDSGTFDAADAADGDLDADAAEDGDADADAADADAD